MKGEEGGGGKGRSIPAVDRVFSSAPGELFQNRIASMEGKGMKGFSWGLCDLI